MNTVNIDLLLTKKGEPGLVADRFFPHPVAGAMYDTKNYSLTLEFSDLDALELNIPVEVDYSVYLTHSAHIHIGVLAGGQLEEARQVPLILLDDPFGGGHGGGLAGRMASSVAAFDHFLKNTIVGQPIHRADLGDEDLVNSVMGGMNGALLEFAPQLARQRTLEAAPQAAPKAPGLGLGGSSGGGRRRIIPPAQREDDE